ncbi:CD225/dispanin family protein [Williamsia maris]|uniref:Interferon-induced transmembrane protein n=1 Tax=Williamsia maris TaxID=72806 RepID=A0ABT1HA48_9NOCA|nr:CD225/dispanin family protein [Williamsia maris]MCP2175133.1 Interferon-induced transmembrane protein [Williamsia maris]
MNYSDDVPTTRIEQQQWIDPTAPSGHWKPREAPKANGGWAVAALLFFWPLAFVAFSKALSVPTLLALGRVQEAQEASDSVVRLGKIALVCGIAIGVVAVVLQVVVLSEVTATSTIR